MFGLPFVLRVASTNGEPLAAFAPLTLGSNRLFFFFFFFITLEPGVELCTSL
jgi:hypothetical protein